MANVELSEEGTNETQPCDVYDEQIEVIEQYVEETRDQNIVGDVKELIFDSLLPTYIPTLPPGFEVDSFFVCEECGDRFTVESSYQFHRDRRSLLIRYDCAECDTTVTSYNRCNLLAHLRLHGNPSHLNLDWSKVYISPLPFDKMLIGPLLNTSENESVLSAASDFSSSMDSLTQCPECGIKCAKDLRSHFQGAGNGLPVDQSNKCKICNMILTTKCSLKAHERYHRQERPYVCPDCAKVFNMWASFCVHLFYCCFHLDKCVRYRCPACKMFLSTSVALEVHILTMHVKNVFKCNACPIACFSLQTLEEHKVKGHGHAGLPTNAYQQCQLCPDRLIPKSRLLFHVIEHVRKPSVSVYGYQCSTCKLFYQKKNDFAAHKSQCSDQSNSNSLDTRNGVVTIRVNGQSDNVLNTTLLNGHSSVVTSTEVSNHLKKENMSGRATMKAAACTVRSNGSQVPKDSHSDVYRERHDTSWADEKTEDANDSEKSVSTSNVTNNNDHTSAEHLFESFQSSNNNTAHLCDTCGQEFTLKKDTSVGSDAPTHCTNCSKEKQPSKTRLRKNSVHSESPVKVNKNPMSNVCKNDKIQNTAKRGKNSIALNGPCNKKIRLSTPEGSDKDKYKCHICKKLIGTEWEAIQDHFAKEHKNFNLLILSPRINKIEIGETKSTIFSASNEKEKKTAGNNCNKSVKIKTEPVDKDSEVEDNQDSKSRRPRRKMPPRGVQNSSSKSVHSMTNQTQSKNDSKRTCFKCKFQSTNGEKFWSHVATHKTDSRAYQCMECGMCFVVKPSFQKHLFISHRIKDVEKYIRDHVLCHQKPKKDKMSQSDDPGVEEIEELEENQCRVCKVKFDTTVQLNKHFRTHGMAFLMMKQQENRSVK